MIKNIYLTIGLVLVVVVGGVLWMTGRYEGLFARTTPVFDTQTVAGDVDQCHSDTDCLLGVCQLVEMGRCHGSASVCETLSTQDECEGFHTANISRCERRLVVGHECVE